MGVSEQYNNLSNQLDGIPVFVKGPSDYNRVMGYSNGHSARLNYRNGLLLF